MIKMIPFLPLHIFNMWLAWFAPNWIFRRVYVRSSDVIREQENQVKNKIRLAQYKIKKLISS